MGIDPVRWAQVRPFAESLVAVKARQILGQAGFRQADLDDIRQDLLLRVLGQLDRHDPARGSLEALVTIVVDSAVKMMLRERDALKRGGGRTPDSLDAASDDERPAVSRLSLVDHARRLGICSTPDQETVDTHLDVREAMSSLPPELLETASLLLQGESEASIARITGAGRRAVKHDVEAIRAHLARLGLGGA